MTETKVRIEHDDCGPLELTLEELEDVVGGRDYNVVMDDCGCKVRVEGVDSVFEAIAIAIEWHDAGLFGSCN